jgi:hypothetical protein
MGDKLMVIMGMVNSRVGHEVSQKVAQQVAMVITKSRAKVRIIIKGVVECKPKGVVECMLTELAVISLVEDVPVTGYKYIMELFVRVFEWQAVY